jgi:hypothetical protein
VAVGISTNLSRPWHKGNHPGLQLARRLKRKAHQVWLFTTRLDVPATNNGSESAIRGFKLAAKVQGCGAPWPPCNATAGSGPTSSAPATTDADPSTPSAMP